jgi:hypothetical protein
MVRAFHRAGLEVILDVVFNHTGEANELGPTLSFRGIDNAIYYWLADDKRYYRDFTGTGQTVNARHPVRSSPFVGRTQCCAGKRSIPTATSSGSRRAGVHPTGSTLARSASRA